MIGHLYTLLFVSGEAPPAEPSSLSYSGGGGHDDALAMRVWQDTERQRQQNNAAAVHFIIALVASGELD